MKKNFSFSKIIKMKYLDYSIEKFNMNDPFTVSSSIFPDS